MKHLFSIIALVASTLVASAQLAAVYQVDRLNGGTNFVAAATTNTIGSTFNVSEYASVDIQITMKASATNVTPFIFNFSKTLDSTTYETTPSLTASLTPNGTNEVSKVYNFSVPNVAGLKLVSIENINANSYGTNISVKWRVKAPKTLAR